MRKHVFRAAVLASALIALSVLTGCVSPPPPAAPAPAPEPAPAPVAQPAAPAVIAMPTILFGPNSGDFRGLTPTQTAENSAALRQVAEILRTHGYAILIEGHANPLNPPGTALRAEEETGSARMPIGLMPLSEQRARTVKAYLTDNHGIDSSMLSSVGRGGTAVVVPFADTANWWRNRRVEFILQR